MKSTLRLVWFLLFLLVIFAGFLFTDHNRDPVTLWLGLPLDPRPLSVWVLGAFVGGGFIGVSLGLGLWRGLKTRLALRQQQQRIDEQEQLIAQLRERLAPLEEKSLVSVDAGKT
ncbi:MAG: LapA family protein [Pseudomonadales bacterium]|nr:LapA family protein [Pseudomonadales bacterium]